MIEAVDYDRARLEGFLPFLLGSISPTIFVDEYWGSKPLLVKGHEGKFAKLFSRSSLDDLQHANSGNSLLAKGEPEIHGCTILRIDPGGKIAELDPRHFDSVGSYGATFQIKNFHRVDRTASELCASLKSELTFAGSVTCEVLLAIPGSLIPNHVDNESVFSIQVEGTRRWRISSRPVIQWPHRTLEMGDDGDVRAGDGEPWEYDVDRLKSDEFADFTLEPGDMLFHPSGAWHKLISVTPGTSGQSISLSMVFRNTMISKLFDELIRSRFASNGAWRNFPVALRSEMPDTIPPRLIEFFSARCHELRMLANSLDPNGLEVQRQWKRLVADYDSKIPDAKQGAHATDEVLPSEQLVLSAGQPLGFVTATDPDGHELAYIYYGSTEVCIDDAQLIPFARTLMRTQAFLAGAATEWADPGMSWDRTKNLLEELTLDYTTRKPLRNTTP